MADWTTEPKADAFQSRNISRTYKHAAKRLGLSLDRPLTDTERQAIEDEVAAVLEDSE